MTLVWSTSETLLQVTKVSPENILNLPLGYLPHLDV